MANDVWGWETLMTGTDSAAADAQLDELAAYLTSRGLAEYGDFYIRGRVAGVAPASEIVALRRSDDGEYKVWYRDMGVERVYVETTDFQVARDRFVTEAVALAASRGRRLREG